MASGMHVGDLRPGSYGVEIGWKWNFDKQDGRVLTY